MINLNFIPSRRMALYAVKLFLTRSLAVLAALVLILMTLDLLGESGKILAVPGNGDADLWRYVGLRLPLLTARFLPFSVLLGTLIAFSGLNQHSEVIAMKAAGMSAHQILSPLIVASLAIAAAAFVFNETIVVKAARIPKDHVLCIGDETRDIEAARRVGLPCAASTWGYATESAMKAAQPDYILHSVDDILRLAKT